MPTKAALAPQTPTKDLTEDITVTVPNVPPLQATASADPRREVVAGGGYGWWGPMLRALPHAWDALSRDFGPDVYTEMAHDPAVQSATRLLRESATSRPVLCAPAVDGEAATQQHPAWAQADAIGTFCKRNLARCSPAIGAVLFDLSEGLIGGHRLGEIVWEDGTLADGTAPQLLLKGVYLKDPRTYAFVLDPYGHQVGVQYAAPGQPLITGNVVSIGPDGTLDRFLLRAKYAHYAYNAPYGDPRGRSLLRSAYAAWWFKTALWPDFRKYLANFAVPMLFGTAAPGAQTQLIDGVSYTPAQLLAAQLELLGNATVLATEAGATLQVLWSQGNGEAFHKAIDLCDHHITLAILGATRATMEAEHGSKADSGTAQDVLELGIQALRTALAEVVLRDVLTPLVRANYGDGALRYLPMVTLGTTERHDFATEATALASLLSAGSPTPFVHRSMFPMIRSALGLPAADEAAEAADSAARDALAAQLAARPVVAPGAVPDGKPAPGTPPNAPPAPQSGAEPPIGKEAPAHATNA